MRYKNTIRAFATVGFIVAAMGIMSSLANSRGPEPQPPEITAAQTLPPVYTATQTPEVIHATQTPEVISAEETDAPQGGYQGIEPWRTEDSLPERDGFVYYPELGLGKVMQDFIFVEAGEAGVNYELVLAIIFHESRCDPTVVSATHDYGLMQINQINHEWLAEEYELTNMLDPRQNVIAGITILAQHSIYDDGTEAGLHRMLMAHNMGARGAAKAWDSGITETNYSRTILQVRDDIIAGVYGKED